MYIQKTCIYKRHVCTEHDSVSCSVVLVWLHIIRFSFSKKASEEENLVLVIVS